MKNVGRKGDYGTEQEVKIKEGKMKNMDKKKKDNRLIFTKSSAFWAAILKILSYLHIYNLVFSGS